MDFRLLREAGKALRKSAQRRALFQNLTRDFLFDGHLLGGTSESRFSHLGCYPMVNSDYQALDCLFADLCVEPGDVLVDAGCGRGRVLNWWLSRGWVNPMFGIEIDPDLAEATRRRLSHFSNVKILTGDAVELLPEEATIIYLFNPFVRETVQRLEAKLRSRCRQRTRLKIIYYAASYVDVFTEGVWDVCFRPQSPSRRSYAFIRWAGNG